MKKGQIVLREIEIRKEIVKEQYYKLKVLVICAITIRKDELDEALSNFMYRNGQHIRYILYKQVLSNEWLGTLHTNKLS